MMSLVSFRGFIVFYPFCDLSYQCRRLAVVYGCGTCGYHFMSEQLSSSWPTLPLSQLSTLTPLFWFFLQLLPSSLLFVTLLGCWFRVWLKQYCSLLWLCSGLGACWASVSYNGYSDFGGYGGFGGCGSWSCWNLNFCVL